MHRCSAFSRTVLAIEIDDIEIDEEYFPDDDEVARGCSGRDWARDWRFNDFPQGFVWQCCGRDPTEQPCLIRKHLVDGQASPPSSSTSSEDDHDDHNGHEREDILSTTTKQMHCSV